MKSVLSSRLKANLRLRVKKLRAPLPLRTTRTTTSTTSSRLTPASMISAVVSVLMLLACNKLVLVNLLDKLLAVDKPKPLLEELSNKDSAKDRSRPPAPTLPAADQPKIMLALPRQTVPALTVTTLLSLLLTVLLLLPLPLEALLPVLVVVASMLNVPKLTAPALTVTTKPSLLLTVLPLPPLLLKAPAETLHLARDSVPDALMPSVPDKLALLLTAETLLSLALTLSDLRDPPLLSLPVATEFSMVPPSADNRVSPSAAALHSVLMSTASMLTAEMPLLLDHTSFPSLPMTGTVFSLANTKPPLSEPLLSSRDLLTFSLLVSVATATNVLPLLTVVFLRFVNLLSNKKL